MTTSVLGVVHGVDKNESAASVELLWKCNSVFESSNKERLYLSMATPPEVIGSAHDVPWPGSRPAAGHLSRPGGDGSGGRHLSGHGWAFASGLSLTEVFGEICQRSIGVNGGRGGSA